MKMHYLVVAMLMVVLCLMIWDQQRWNRRQRETLEQLHELHVEQTKAELLRRIRENAPAVASDNVAIGIQAYPFESNAHHNVTLGPAELPTLPRDWQKTFGAKR